MRKIICDRCEEEIGNDQLVNTITFRLGRGDAGNETTKELCGSCFTAVVNNIRTYAQVEDRPA